MATETKLRQLADKGCPVYYFYSSERYLVRQAVAAATRILTADSDEDATVLDGAAPEIEQLIMAAGTISFFGTRRVVVLPEIDPAAYSDKDLEELNSTLSSLENAVVVLGSVFELERSKLKTGKRAQKLIAQCKALGYTEELAKPKPFELKMMMIDRAKEQKTTLPDGAAAALLERDMVQYISDQQRCWSAAARIRSFWKMRWTNSVHCPGIRRSRQRWWRKWARSVWKQTCSR